MGFRKDFGRLHAAMRRALFHFAVKRNRQDIIINATLGQSDSFEPEESSSYYSDTVWDSSSSMDSVHDYHNVEEAAFLRQPEVNASAFYANWRTRSRILDNSSFETPIDEPFCPNSSPRLPATDPIVEIVELYIS
ncbi:DEKNAAC101701 [Brettanomyces naardenensis]|uniref:DEKNAAC101701 n=1 Tax=Brettanomyces naardenensis TaxID=13370 RepID=A0A448YIW1_BRENA|nr:DEKNAAC101701 [Brettanomyces naardenensis]